MESVGLCQEQPLPDYWATWVFYMVPDPQMTRRHVKSPEESGNEIA